MKLLKYMLIMLLGCAVFSIPCSLLVEMPISIFLSICWGGILGIVLGNIAVSEHKIKPLKEPLKDHEIGFLSIVAKHYDPKKHKKINFGGKKMSMQELLLSTCKGADSRMQNLEILNTIWYGKLGIIKARDKTTNEIKIYIGEGEGEDERTDIYKIVSFGTKYTPESFRELINVLVGD